MSKILTRAQPYIQLEEAMKASSNHSAKSGDGEGKSKFPHKAPDRNQDRHRGQLAHKKQALPILSLSSLHGSRSMEGFTPLKLPISEIFNTIKDQPWARHPRPPQHNSSLPGLEEYNSYREGKGHQTTVGPFESTWKSL